METTQQNIIINIKTSKHKMNNLGWTFYEENQFEQSIEQFNNAIVKVPEFPSARFNLSMVNLMQGDFEKGWANYESRKQLEAYKNQKILLENALCDTNDYPIHGLFFKSKRTVF